MHRSRAGSRVHTDDRDSGRNCNCVPRKMRETATVASSGWLRMHLEQFRTFFLGQQQFIHQAVIRFVVGELLREPFLLKPSRRRVAS